MSFDPYDYSLLTVFVFSIAVFAASIEIGRLFAARTKGRDRGGSQVTTLEAAMLGLLALLIGFTFSMALYHYDMRRGELLTEANAIGTTALRARLLPAPHDLTVLKLLREYAQIRLDVTEPAASVTTLKTALDRSRGIHEALWQQATAVAAKTGEMVPTGLFIETLNNLIDSEEKRLTALRYRVPHIVLIELYGLTAAVLAFAGYVNAVERPRSRLQVYVVSIVISCVLLLVQDLDRPIAGFISVNQQPMIDTADSIAAMIGNR